jgi:hypothetical protein
MPWAGHDFAPLRALEHAIARRLGPPVPHRFLERGLEPDPGADLSHCALLQNLGHARLFLGQAQVGPLAVAFPGRVDPGGPPSVLRPQQVAYGVRGAPHVGRNDGGRLGVHQRLAHDPPPAHPPGFPLVFDPRITLFHR